MYWSYYRSGRVCLLGHKWVATKLWKQSFSISETCSWCGKRRDRALLPADEQKEREKLAYERGRQERVLFARELTYQRAKGGPASNERIAERWKQFGQSYRALDDEIRSEKRKDGTPDRAKIREIRSQIRGLLFGK